MVNVLENRITKAYSGLTKSQKKVAEYIIRSPEEVAFLSLKALGEKVKFSDATIIRLSNALGLGFRSFKRYCSPG
jgi:DNA-binding MurR/RpiR family transcriptional regulator